MEDEYAQGGSGGMGPPGSGGSRGVVPPGQHSDGVGPATGPPPTGDEQVDSALAGLSRLPGRPPEEHVAVLEEVHGRLRDILGEIGETPEAPEGHEPR
jgi:hypothetical protein